MQGRGATTSAQADKLEEYMEHFWTRSRRPVLAGARRPGRWSREELPALQPPNISASEEEEELHSETRTSQPASRGAALAARNPSGLSSQRDSRLNARKFNSKPIMEPKKSHSMVWLSRVLSLCLSLLLGAALFIACGFQQGERFFPKRWEEKTKQNTYVCKSMS